MCVCVCVSSNYRIKRLSCGHKRAQSRHVNERNRLTVPTPVHNGLKRGQVAEELSSASADTRTRNERNEWHVQRRRRAVCTRNSSTKLRDECTEARPKIEATQFAARTPHRCTWTQSRRTVRVVEKASTSVEFECAKLLELLEPRARPNGTGRGASCEHMKRKHRTPHWNRRAPRLALVAQFCALCSVLLAWSRGRAHGDERRRVRVDNSSSSPRRGLQRAFRVSYEL